MTGVGAITMDAALENEVAKLTDEDEEPATATREKLV
jgi:1,6-anhydro-N-acetylmuramate kinase